MTVVRKVSVGKIGKLLQASKCQSLALVSPAILSRILEEQPEEISVGVGSRSILRGTHRDRYSVDEYRNSRFGWHGLFAILEEDGPPVGLFSLRGGGWSLIVLTDEDVEAILAVLVASPQSVEWPKGAEYL
ncbi:hypothetical protein [Polymorphospora rubra]|uniref:Uncharacterized protein n=1 Tax=Polymorphospora rubra TaxID=338584 RepID=A0A810N5F3_9ACTN|nr:hypothetical protein [Polymorphospora rubra]BCJ66913.1 hypothetical protein Prubr_39340 [Polymorphospora rubra]